MRAGRLFVAVVLLCMSMICRAGKGGADVKIAYSADNGRYYATVSRQNESEKVGLGAEKDVLGLPHDASLYTEPYSEKAYGLLFAPIEPYLKPGDRIFFSPVSPSCNNFNWLFNFIFSGSDAISICCFTASICFQSSPSSFKTIGPKFF